MTIIKAHQGFAISAAFESGITTVWTHDGFRFELEGIREHSNTGVLSVVPDRLDQMPVEFEVDSVVCSGGRLRLNFVTAMTLEIYLDPEREPPCEVFE